MLKRPVQKRRSATRLKGPPSTLRFGRKRNMEITKLKTATTGIENVSGEQNPLQFYIITNTHGEITNRIAILRKQNREGQHVQEECHEEWFSNHAKTANMNKKIHIQFFSKKFRRKIDVEHISE